jgi:low temperature requirement protein LtrA
MSAARKIYGAPVLLQDWDSEAGEVGAAYWELFLDLLLVAAASSTADGLKDNPTMAGVAEFCVIYGMFINCWMMYSCHITTRFEDGTLLHTLNLFVFLLGFAYSVVNAGYDTASQFSLGAIVSRVSLLIMLLNIYVFIPRARQLSIVMGSSILLVVAVLVVPAIWPDLAPICWWIVVAIETLMEFTNMPFLRGTKLVPINIDKSKERLGCIVLIMLGESVLSGTILYREIKNEEGIQNEQGYVWVLTLAFLLVFMFTLIHFHMSPPAADHAFRRSRIHGCLLLICYRLLGLALLAVGVAVKLFVLAVVEDEELTPFASRLMGNSVGAALATNVMMRILHYGGRMPRPHDPPDVKLIMWCWWGSFALAVLIPFYAAGLGWKGPVYALAFYASFLFGMTVVESIITHVLEAHLIVHGVHEGGGSLLTQGEEKPVSYQSTVHH